MPNPRQLAGRVGGLRSWSHTVDRTARTAPARSHSPSSVDYWLERQDERFDTATPEQRLAAAEAARRCYFAELAMKSARARRGTALDHGVQLDAGVKLGGAA